MSGKNFLILPVKVVLDRTILLEDEHLTVLLVVGMPSGLACNIGISGIAEIRPGLAHDVGYVMLGFGVAAIGFVK